MGSCTFIWIVLDSIQTDGTDFILYSCKVSLSAQRQTGNWRTGVVRYQNVLNRVATGIAYSLRRLATGWKAAEVETSHTRPDHPKIPPSLLYSGYGVISGHKAAGACCSQPTNIHRLGYITYTSTPPLCLRGVLHFPSTYRATQKSLDTRCLSRYLLT